MKSATAEPIDIEMNHHVSSAALPPPESDDVIDWASVPACECVAFLNPRLNKMVLLPFDPANLVYGPTEPKDAGCASIPIGYRVIIPGSTPETRIDVIVWPLKLQGPPMTTPFALSYGFNSITKAKITSPPTDRKAKCTIGLDLAGYNRRNKGVYDSPLLPWFAALRKLDQANVAVAQARATALWPTKSVTPDTVASYYTALTRKRLVPQKVNGIPTGIINEFPPRLDPIKVSRFGGDAAQLYNESKTKPERLAIEGLKPNALLTASIETSGLWVMPTSFSCPLKLVQARVERDGTPQTSMIVG